MNRRTLALALIFTTMAMILMACSGGDGEADIRKTVEGFFNAINEDDLPAAYTFLSEECKEQVTFGEFAGGMVFAQAFLGEGEFKVKDVRIIELKDDEAIIESEIVLVSDGEEIELEDGDATPIVMVKEDGRWRSTDCEDFLDGDTDAEAGKAVETPTVVALEMIDLGDVAEVDASVLPELAGESLLAGNLSVRFISAEVTPFIDTEFEGRQDARGKFLVVVYEVESNLDARMQPATQISDKLVLTDNKGRKWERADYEGDYGGISNDAAEARGCDSAAAWIGAGFTGCTAIVFDVPEDATGFSLQWERAGLSVDLGE